MDSFALAHASGTEWKSITKKCLADLSNPEARPGFEMLGLVYMTDSLAGDAGNILKLLRSRTMKKLPTVACVLGRKKALMQQRQQMVTLRVKNEAPLVMPWP